MRGFGKRVVKKIANQLQKNKYKRENPEIRNLLAGLYPGEDAEQRYQEYRIQKCIIVVAVIMIGTGAFICLQVSSQMEGRLKEGTHLSRNEWGEGSYFVTLQAKTASGEGEITYQVKERIFTEKEIEKLLSQAKEKLAQVILAENVSLTQVTGDLELVRELSGYPFSISWKSGDYDKIRTDGKVNLENVTMKGEEVLLTAVFSYEGKTWEQLFSVRLMPKKLSEKESFLWQLRKLLSENDMFFAEKTEIVLPQMLENEVVSWQEKKADNSIWLLALGGVGALLCVCGMDRDLRKKDQARKNEILQSYPEFVSRLKLYMGAGLTIRNAFLRIGRDYRQEKRQTGRKKYLYEEVLISGYQLSNGKREDWVYREWGRRCDVMCCRKLGFLLTSTLRQGNKKILSVLEKEVCFAWEERKNKAKKQGEEAGTKMLFPMLLMLLMVMFLILLPAFIGLQGA